jgi:hypothetical protein
MGEKRLVDARAKGARGENLVKDLLIKHTKLPWVRTPLSGALDVKYQMKGDLMLPNSANRFCIEVKNYKESPLSDKIFTSKTNNLILWWEKLKKQSSECNQDPLLFFKYDRSKIYVVTDIFPDVVEKYIYISWLDCYIILAEEWLGKESIKWLL